MSSAEISTSQPALSSFLLLPPPLQLLKNMMGIFLKIKFCFMSSCSLHGSISTTVLFNVEVRQSAEQRRWQFSFIASPGSLCRRQGGSLVSQQALPGSLCRRQGGSLVSNQHCLVHPVGDKVVVWFPSQLCMVHSVFDEAVVHFPNSLWFILKWQFSFQAIPGSLCRRGDSSRHSV